MVLSRLGRFQKALRLRQATGRSWTWIAHEAHYHDQMHLIREFQEFALIEALLLVKVVSIQCRIPGDPSNHT